MIVRKVGALSLAKFLGGIYAVIGFIIGGIFSLMALAGAAIGGAQSDEPAAAMIGAVVGVGAVIVLPIVYGLMGFVGGLITALLYNLFAGIFGGIELEVDMQTARPAAAPAGYPPPQTSAFS